MPYPKYHCPKQDCPNHETPEPKFYRKKGYYKTKHYHQPVPRYQCKTCGKFFSSHTFRDTKGQKKPQLNQEILKLYSSGTTQRRLAKVLGCNRKTVVRKFLWLADKAYRIHLERIKTGKLKTSYVQFDEMETFEHTRLKPLSVSIAVRPKTGEIIDVRIASMKAKGRNADLAYLRYGDREDTRFEARSAVIHTVGQCAKRSFTIISDSHSSYPNIIKDKIPHAMIEKVSSGRTRKFGSDFDPLFALNHLCAVLRNDLSRLMRKTWTTTKCPACLRAHLHLYIAYRNGYDLR